MQIPFKHFTFNQNELAFVKDIIFKSLKENLENLKNIRHLLLLTVLTNRINVGITCKWLTCLLMFYFEMFETLLYTGVSLFKSLSIP